MHVVLICCYLGTLLHFDDHNLRDFYFLNPQWLAKLMADVIHPQAIQGDSPVINGTCYTCISHVHCYIIVLSVNK